MGPSQGDETAPFKSTSIRVWRTDRLWIERVQSAIYQDKGTRPSVQQVIHWARLALEDQIEREAGETL